MRLCQGALGDPEVSRHVEYRPKHSKSPRSSIFVRIPALLVAAVMLTAAAVGVALGGNSTLQIARAAAADDTSPPWRPRYLRLAGATSTSVTLAWRRPYDNVGVTGYNVNAGGPTFRTTETTYTITSLACATTYGVAVTAYDAAGNESRAARITVSTAACAPPRLPSPPPPPPPHRRHPRRRRRRRPSSPSHRVTVRRSRVRSLGP